MCGRCSNFCIIFWSRESMDRVDLVKSRASPRNIQFSEGRGHQKTESGIHKILYDCVTCDHHSYIKQKFTSYRKKNISALFRTHYWLCFLLYITNILRNKYLFCISLTQLPISRMARRVSIRGSRRQVWNGTKQKTRAGTSKDAFMMTRPHAASKTNQFRIKHSTKTVNFANP